MITDSAVQDGPAQREDLTRASRTLGALADVTLPVVIEFGRLDLTVQEVLELGPGSAIQLDRMVGEPVTVCVSDRPLAHGEVVVLGEYFGVRITKLLPTPAAAAT